MAEINRVWAMPNSATFEIEPIAGLVTKYLRGIAVDPFSNGKQLAMYTNDLNPNVEATSHEKADTFLKRLAIDGVVADVVLFDPPYSPRQISECYKVAGLTPTMEDTQNAAFYSRCRKWIEQIVRPGGVVLSFGWNSTGMGRSWERVETLLVCHGSAHNDTICVVDRKPHRLI